MYLTEMQSQHKTTSEEINRIQTEVYNHYIEELSKEAKKNQMHIHYMKRQITLLMNRDRQRVLQEIDNEEQRLQRLSTQGTHDLYCSDSSSDSE